MNEAFRDHLSGELDQLTEQGLRKGERVIASPQQARVNVDQRDGILNLCANNYLGLANDDRLIKAAHDALDQRGFGLASVRFICGTQDIHRQLERSLADFLGTDDTILYSSCFDANGGLFETLLGEQDAVISDALNHASIIDGVRLCKAKRFRYHNNDMADLEAKLREAREGGSRFRLIVTDGVFSMDGYLADLPAICDLADRYEALVMVDDSHAVGFMGDSGGGTPEHFGVRDRVDIVTGTLGKALGGASGGYTSGRQVIVDYLRQRSRPYLFSNSVAPPIVAASIKAIELVRESSELRRRLHENTRYFREQISELGYEVLPGEHPIVPIMLHDAALAGRVAMRMFELGVYVVAFSYPVVPMGKARIRTQISAGHTRDDLRCAIDAFAQVKRELGL